MHDPIGEGPPKREKKQWVDSLDRMSWKALQNIFLTCRNHQIQQIKCCIEAQQRRRWKMSKTWSRTKTFCDRQDCKNIVPFYSEEIWPIVAQGTWITATTMAADPTNKIWSIAFTHNWTTSNISQHISASRPQLIQNLPPLKALGHGIERGILHHQIGLHRAT